MKTPDDMDPAEGSPQPTEPQHLPTPEAVRVALTKKGTEASIISLLVQFLERGVARGCRNYGQLAKLIGKDSTTVSRALRGEYQARMDSLGRAIAHWVGVDVQRSSMCEVGLLPTSVFANLRTHFALVRATQTIGLVTGMNQTGKTVVSEGYAKEVPNTYYVRIPSGGAMGETLGRFAQALGASRYTATARIMELAETRLNANSLVIWDELHQCLIGRNIRTNTIERIREIKDITKSAATLIGTEVMMARFSDPRFLELLGQTANRGTLRLTVPREPTPEDLRLVREAYGFPPLDRGSEASGELLKLANAHGIGRLCKTLAQARMLATEGQRPTWENFMETLATNAASERGILRKGGAE